MVTAGPDNVHQLPLPDPAVIGAHLDRLFARCPTEYPGGLIEIAWSPSGDWAVSNAQLFPATAEGLAVATALATALNRDRSNVYVGVNPRKPGSPERGRCGAEHVEIAFFQFCECDKAESLELLRHSSLPFSFFVITGRSPNARVHGYIEMRSPDRDLRLWRRRQKAMRARYRGDSVIDPPRLMRLAGTVNYPAPHKVTRGYKPELVELHCTKTEPVSEDEFDFGPTDNTATKEAHPHGAAGAERPHFGDDKIAEWLARIDADDHWHNNARDLVAKLVSEGYDRCIIFALAPRLTRPGYTVEQTTIELEEFISGAEAKYGNGAGEAGDDADEDWEGPPEQLDSWDDGDDEAPIAPREWLLGRFFCREFVSSVLGDGTVGKTAFRVACALSAATGRILIGEPVYQRCRVLLVCFEDSRDELRRRIRAAKIHHKISPEETRGWLRLCVLSRSDLKLAHLDHGGGVRTGRLGELLEREIVEHRIDVLILDPLIKTHSLPENSNEAIDYVASLLTDLAIKNRLAVDTPHHIRKGATTPGDADAGRGASAAKNAFRLVYTLTKMTEKEAELFQLSDAERRQLIRLDSAKVNIAPSSDARWYRLVGVPLGNQTDRYPEGDEIAVVECWSVPDLFDGLTIDLVNEILDEVDRGLADGTPYSDKNAAEKRAAWKVVARYAPYKSEGQCREIIRVWVKNMVLIHEEYRDKQHGRDTTGLRVNPKKRPR
jgi:hypothetical protein